MLDEDESFSLSAYVESPGYQRMSLTGYLVQKRSDGTYIGSLLPQMFYGVNGSPLSSWRQYIPSSGEQVILSRSGGLPKVPREDIYWRKVGDVVKEAPVPVEPTTAKLEISPTFALILGLIGGAILLKIIGGK